MNNVVELNHPLIKHKLGLLRNKETGTKEFRELIDEISSYLCYKAFEDIELDDVEIETPICKTMVKYFDENEYVFLPILRAGIGMSQGILKVIPNAKFGHIGMQRDDENNHKAVNYYFKVPSNIESKNVIIIDPMLATGGSIISTIEFLKEKNVKNIKILCIIAAPEGLENIRKIYPNIKIYCASIDEKLNENAYIVPGLGDAGDRIFGTK